MVEKEEKQTKAQRERSKKNRRAEMQALEIHVQAMMHLEAGGTKLARTFALACGVQTPSDVFKAARIFRKQKVREFWNYIIFLVIFSASTLQQRPVELTHDFVSNIGASLTTLGDGTLGVLQNNLIVQQPRLRQIRVLREDCEVPRRMSSSDFGGLLLNGSNEGTNFKLVDGRGDCYPSMRTATIDDTGHWGLIIVNGTVKQTPLPYRSDKELNTKACDTRATTTPNTYEGGGYVQEFPLALSNKQFVEMLTALKDMGWTDRHTRCVFFDTSIYNLELNTFLNIRIAFEFQPHGFVMTYLSKRSFRMGFVRGQDQLLLGMDALVYGFVLISLGLLCKKVWLLGMKFFTYVWNTVDMLNLIFFLIPLYYKVIFFNLTSPFIAAPAHVVTGYPLSSATGNGSSSFQPASTLLDYDGTLDEEYIDLEYAGWVYNMVALLNGFNSLFTWLKIFAFLRFLNPQAHILKSLGHSNECSLYVW